MGVAATLPELSEWTIFQVAIFKFIFLLNREGYNHELSRVDAETSS